MQATALQNLRKHAVIVYQQFADETKRIEKILSSHHFPRSHSNLIDFTKFNYSNSQVELTIEQHREPPSNLNSSSTHLVVKEDGKSYPKNPTNGYITRYPNGFFACLGCGVSSCQYTECKYNRVNIVRTLYW